MISFQKNYVLPYQWTVRQSRQINYSQHRMNNNSKLKKLKTLTTLDTNCTFEDFGDTAIKINIINPKDFKNITTTNSQTTLPSPQVEDQMTLSIRQSNKKLMTVPELTLREFSGYMSSSNGRQLENKQNLDIYKNELKSSKGHSSNLGQSIVNIQASGLLTNSLVSHQSKQGGPIINNIINTQSKKVEKPIWTNSQPIAHSNLHHQPHTQQKNNNFSIKFQISAERSDDQEKKQIDIDHQPSFMMNSQIEERYNQSKPIPSLKLAEMNKKMPPLKKSKRKDVPLKKVTSDSRIKLKDYLYMVETSSKKASIERHDLIHQRKISPRHLIVPEAADKKTTNFVNHKQEKPISSVTSKETYVNAKYKITNSQMFSVLKQEITEDLADIQKYLSEINRQLEEVYLQGEPSNEELLALYNLRRELKDQLMMRTLSALQSIRRDKQTNLLKSRRCDEQQVQEIDCSQFLLGNI